MVFASDCGWFDFLANLLFVSVAGWRMVEVVFFFSNVLSSISLIYSSLCTHRAAAASFSVTSADLLPCFTLVWLIVCLLV